MKSLWKSKGLISIAFNIGFLAIVFNPFSVLSQVATKYTFAQSAGTYSAILGGSVFASSAFNNMDDEVSRPVIIPPFSFDGNIYTSLFINTNGYITFGKKSPLTSSYNAISGAEEYNGAVAAFSTDLDAATSGAAEIRYQQVGNEFIIQWQNVSRPGVLGEHISFQIRLNTSDNRINIVYGGTITPGVNTAYPEIGLRGPDNTFSTNVNNRRIISGTGAWVNSLAGTSNASNCYFNATNSATKPAVGTTFTWSPPATDLQATSLFLPGTNGCYGRNETVSIAIRNSGSSAINFSSTPATVSSSVTGTNAITFTPVPVNSGTLAPNATQNIIVSSNYNMSLAGVYVFNASVSIAGDAYTSNNAMQPESRESHTPSVSASADVSLCQGQSTNLGSTASAYSFLQSSTNTTPTSIPDDSPAGVNSTITIAGSTATASQASVRIDFISHTFDDDLILMLKSPNNSIIYLSIQEGGGGANYEGTLFSSTAVTPISSGSAPFTGTYLPENSFSLLSGSANGTWTLNVSDNAGADVGSLLGWTLILPVSNNIASFQWSPPDELSSASISNPSATPSSTTMYSVTVNDATGCSNSDSVLVTVIPYPVVSPPTVTQPDCANQTGTIKINTIANGALEYKLDGGTFQADSVFGSLTPGNYNITVRLQNYPFCESTYTGNPVVINQPDNVNPQIICPSDTAVSCDHGACSAIVNPGQPSATDNCPQAIGIAGTRSDHLPLTDPYPIGVTTIAWTATDFFGNKDSCQQTIQVSDNEAPQVTCPVNVHVSNDPGMCHAVLDPGSITATDNCVGAIALSGSRSDGHPLSDPYPVGSTLITWKATDIHGNSDSCQQTIAVDDSEKPVIVCPADTSITENPAGSGSASFDPGTATGIDNCPGIIITGTRSDAQPLNAPYPVGLTTILWLATDAAGNVDTCIQSIHVQSSCHITCPSDTIVFSSTSQCGVNVNYPNAVITGDCGISTYSIPSGSFFPVGIDTVKITTTAGASCLFTITVKDTVRPVISCPANANIQSSPGSCNAVFNFISPVTTDNCSGVIVTCSPPSGSVFPVGTTTVTCVAKDSANNTSGCSFTVTVTDNEKPVIHCPASLLINADANKLYASNVATGSATATDNCGVLSITGTRSDALALTANYPVGITRISWLASDIHGNSDTCSQTITVVKRSSAITYTGDTSVQYSDYILLRALLKDQLTNVPLSGKTITFNTGIQSISSVTNASGIATVNLYIFRNPGTFSVTTTFAGDSSSTGSADTDLIRINKENAEVVYTGPEFVNVPCSNCASTQILLSASVKDISSAAVPGDPNPGDIRKARVRFINDDTNIPISGWLPVGLVNNPDSTRGTVSFAWTVPIPAAGYIDPYTVRIEVDSGNYIGSTDVVINISRSTMTDFISGGGHTIPTLSSGQYASDPLKKMHFGFNVKFNHSGQNLQGKLNMVFRRTQGGIVHVYQVKGNVFTSLSVRTTGAAKNAAFTCKTTLKDVTNPRYPVTLGTNLTLQVITTDRGFPGTNDSIGFTLWSSTNSLLYSSNWVSTKTVAKNLSSGNILIFTFYNNIRIAEENAGEEKITEADLFRIHAMPNPSMDFFRLIIESKNSRRINLSVTDLLGKLIETKNDLMPGEAIEIGSGYKPGIYFVQVDQDGILKTIKILKQQ